MALKKSEKILAGTTGGLLVVIAGVFLFRGGGDSLSDLRTRHDELKKTVTELEIQARPLDKASAKLDAWRKRSMPGDSSVAGREYNEWLWQLADDRLDKADISRLNAEQHRGIYTTLPFRIDGEGTLDQLTRFLFEFDSTGYLHKVSQLSVDPIEGSQNLKLGITVEALSLSSAADRDVLPDGLSSRLEHAEPDEYLDMIDRRKMEMEGDRYRYVKRGGLFASYAPKPPPVSANVPPPRRPDPERPSFDPSEHTYVSSIRTEDGVPVVWLLMRTEGRKLELHEGDAFKVGKMCGTIARIRVDELDIEIEVDGRRQLVAFGKNLHDAADLPE